MAKKQTVFVLTGMTIDYELIVDVFATQAAAEAHMEECWDNLEDGEEEPVIHELEVGV